MIRALLLAALVAVPAVAQPMDHSMHDLSKMAPAADQHAGHDTSAMEPATTPTTEGGTALKPGDAQAPEPPIDHYADRFYPPATMQQVRDAQRAEHGGQSFSQIMFNRAEYQAVKGRDGYRWGGEAWFGGDIDRLTIKSEGEGLLGGGIEAAEVQALYSRAVDPYWNLQAGVRHDFSPDPQRTYATIGVEGLAPYWFDVEAALFLSDKGDLLGRIESYYDQRITQRLVLQPRAELNFAAQDVRETGTGSGLSTAELGLRLRYELTREFAPYVGMSWERKAGDTARFARAEGDGRTSKGVVFGLRFWF
jgi:copper resistance protein B